LQTIEPLIVLELIVLPCYLHIGENPERLRTTCSRAKGLMAELRVCDRIALLTISLLVPAIVRSQDPELNVPQPRPIEQNVEHPSNSEHSTESFPALLNRSICCFRERSESGKNCRNRNSKGLSCRTSVLNACAESVALFHRKATFEKLTFCCRHFEEAQPATIAAFHPRLRSFQESLDSIYPLDAWDIFYSDLDQSIVSTAPQSESEFHGSALAEWSDLISWSSDFGGKSRAVALHRFNHVEASADSFWNAWHGRSPSFESEDSSGSIFDHFYFYDANMSPDNPPLRIMPLLRSLPEQVYLKWTFIF
jgi:hypothetical protein